MAKSSTTSHEIDQDVDTPLGEAPGKGTWNEIKATQSPELKSMVRHAKSLQNDLGRLDEKILEIEENLHTLGECLSWPGRVAKNLRRMDSALEKTKTLLAVIKLFPAAKDRVVPFERELDRVHSGVKSGRAKAEAVATKVEPVRVEVAKMERRAGTLYAALELIRKPLYDAVSRAAVNVQGCINLTPDAKKRARMQRRANEIAKAVDAVLVEMDEVVLALLEEMDVGAKGIPVPEIRGEAQLVQTLCTRIGRICESLESLGPSLDESFELEVPYTVPSWKPPFIEVRHFSITLPVKTILQGSSAIKNAIDHQVGKGFRKAMELFGLNKAIEFFQNAARSAEDDILEVLGLSLKLPECEALVSALGKLDAPRYTSYGGFEIPEHLDFDFSSVPADLRKLKSPDHPWDSVEGCKYLDLGLE